jgi:hypothetical protein
VGDGEALEEDIICVENVGGMVELLLDKAMMRSSCDSSRDVWRSCSDSSDRDVVWRYGDEVSGTDKDWMGASKASSGATATTVAVLASAVPASAVLASAMLASAVRLVNVGSGRVLGGGEF